MKVYSMFGSPLPTLTVAGVMTLLAFPAGANTHEWSHDSLGIDMANNSEFPIIEVCIESFSHRDIKEECFRDLDWAAGTSHTFWVPCEEQILIEYDITFTVQNGDEYGDSLASHYCTANINYYFYGNE
jgi:hypothetical protein